MRSHTLSDNDKWFIKKNRVDTLSRSPFSTGDNIVVCANKHVMLLDFYEGTCPSCQSYITVPFNYANVEHGYKLTEADAWFVDKNPIDKVTKRRISVDDTVVICDNKHMSLITSYDGKCPVCNSETIGSIPIRTELLAWFFPMKFARELLPKVNNILGWILGVLITGVFLLIITGVISNEGLIDHAQMTLIPKTTYIFINIGDFLYSETVGALFFEKSELLIMKMIGAVALLLTSIGTFVVSKEFNALFIETSGTIIVRHEFLLANMVNVLLLLLNGFKDICIGLWRQLQIMYFKTQELIELFMQRTRMLFDMVFG